MTDSIEASALRAENIVWRRTTKANAARKAKNQPAVNLRFLPAGALCTTGYNMQTEEISREGAESRKDQTGLTVLQAG